METKRCTRCEETKPLSKFHKDKNSKDGHTNWCKRCSKEYYIENREKVLERRRRYYQEHREEILERDRERYDEKRDRNLQRSYGITLREYDLMLEIQNGGCAICGMTPKENVRRLCVDHDHETGEVRGLLCNRCNKSLGLLEDSPELCDLLKLYLYKHGK